jgi:hypothetical protein
VGALRMEDDLAVDAVVRRRSSAGQVVGM